MYRVILSLKAGNATTRFEKSGQPRWTTPQSLPQKRKNRRSIGRMTTKSTCQKVDLRNSEPRNFRPNRRSYVCEKKLRKRQNLNSEKLTRVGPRKLSKKGSCIQLYKSQHLLINESAVVIVTSSALLINTMSAFVIVWYSHPCVVDGGSAGAIMQIVELSSNEACLHLLGMSYCTVPYMPSKDTMFCKSLDISMAHHVA